MATRTIQRFYNTASSRAAAEGGFAVVLDDRPVKTPQTRAELIVPSAALAEAVAAEWAAQEDTLRPYEMPLTALACTALDVAVPRREALVDGLLRYAETDLLCFRVPHPPKLAERQHALWQPLLDWAALTYDARLDTTTGIQPPSQPPAALQGLEAGVQALDSMRLAALSASVRVSDSLVLGLALVAGRVDADAAFEAAEVEATHQIEEWGEEAEALKRRVQVHAELAAADRFVRLLEA